MAVNNVNIQAFNCEVTDEHRQHFEDKVGNLERLWPRVEEAQIRITEVRGRYVTEITLISGGMVTRGEERSSNIRAAFDTALHKLEGQLRRHKDREIGRRNRHEHSNGTAPETLVPPVTDNEDHLVRVKKFALKPMSPEEAVLQMDLLGHNFFVFRDSESNQTSVVYKRQDGGYGLIEPVAA